MSARCLVHIRAVHQARVIFVRVGVSAALVAVVAMLGPAEDVGAPSLVPLLLPVERVHVQTSPLRWPDTSSWFSELNAIAVTAAVGPSYRRRSGVRSHDDQRWIAPDSQPAAITFTFRPSVAADTATQLIRSGTNADAISRPLIEYSATSLLSAGPRRVRSDAVTMSPVVWLIAAATIGPGMRSSERTKPIVFRSHTIAVQSHPPLPDTSIAYSRHTLRHVIPSRCPCRFALSRKSMRRGDVSQTRTTPAVPPEISRLPSFARAQHLMSSSWWFSITPSSLSPTSTMHTRMLPSQWSQVMLLLTSVRSGSRLGPDTSGVCVWSTNSTQCTGVCISILRVRTSVALASVTIEHTGDGSGGRRCPCGFLNWRVGVWP
eukprot:Unigene8732_Nuclearia_a/m.26722 Unigene8732_Nuclearia_a/g.26722  ORF Unigene8732_Nuclearia_a/g.26722 Unigene8732_Nuclearia_a/m.26722 type:complete len:375 (+) Unigene8732_Nuclearia_a:8-1132(+)